MASSVEHTATPFYWDKDIHRPKEGVIIGANLAPICRVTLTNQEANAEFIVRACNSFDSLLAACAEGLALIEALLAANGEPVYRHAVPERPPVPVLLRAALAKAKEK